MRQRAKAILGMLMLLQFLQCMNLFNRRPFMDEGIYLTSAWMYMQGAIPYVEFILVKPLGIVWAFAALFSLVEPTIFNARAFMALVSLAQLAMIFLIAKRAFKSEQAGLAAAFLFVLWNIPFSNYLTANEPFMALFQSIAILSLYIFLYEKKSSIALVGFSLSLGISMLFKQTAAIFAVLFAAAFIWLHLREKKALPSAKEFGILAAGLALPGLIMLVHIWQLNAIPEFVEIMLFPIGLAESASFLVIDSRILIALGAFAFVPVALIALWKKSRIAKGSEKALMLLLLWFLAGFINMFPFRGCCFHLITALPAASVIGGFAIAASLEKRENKLLLLFTAAVLALSIIASVSMQSVLASDTYCFDQIEDVAQYVKQNTGPEERILVMPTVPELYFLSKRQPSARQLQFFDEFTPEFQQQILEQVKENRPVMVIYFSQQRQLLYTGPELVDDYIKENYTEREAIALEPALYKFFNYAIILEPN
ncbi:MAG: glycosyltransferase family 39 protein [Candidatus Diapherotrites archaeon]|uniref:Glycosyltransferase family 39 protein n=1 Tax=Candidatus Iainarchaeum sp. TaxID=3101447 RepID=A0A938YX50_9ARCH|nr:glycosyltransferase family 39 protein [Candidatus Diapherotrites archaeon]